MIAPPKRSQTLREGSPGPDAEGEARGESGRGLALVERGKRTTVPAKRATFVPWARAEAPPCGVRAGSQGRSYTPRRTKP